MADNNLPPLPPGFELEGSDLEGATPPLPPGFVLESAEQGQAQELPVDPTVGMSGYEKLMAAVGGSIEDSFLGMKQVGAAGLRNLASDSTGLTSGENAVTRWADRAGERIHGEIEAKRKIDSPLLATGAGQAGNVIGQITQMAIPVGGVSARASSLIGRVAPYVGAATRAGTFQAVQPMTGDQNRASEVGKSALLGAVGQGVASGAAKIAARGKEAITPVVQRSIEAARAADIPLHLSQVTGSRFLKTVGSVVNNLPFTGANAAAKGQQEAFNRAVGRSFGQEAKVLSDDVMLSARKKIGAVYDNVFSKNSVNLGPSDVSQLMGVVRAASKDLTEDKAKVVRNQLSKIIDDFADGPVAGTKYQSLRDSLAAAIDETPTGAAIKRLRKIVDTAAFNSVGAADAAALKRANSMWANMKTAEKALKQASGSATQGGGAAGNIRPTALWPLVRDGSTKEMRELAQIGQNVLKDPIPNSGTPERQMVLNLLGLGGAGYVAQNDSLPMWARLAGGGILAGRALNSGVAAKMLGQGRPLTGLARLVSPAPRVLPAAAPMVDIPLELDISGGTRGAPITEEELKRLRNRR